MGKKPQLTFKEKRYISFCEKHYFFRNQGFPSDEIASEELGYTLNEIRSFRDQLRVQKALEARGLPYSDSSSDLDYRQVSAALVASNFADTRDLATKLESIGISSTQYYAWLQHPVFRNYVQQLADRNLENVRPAAVAELSRKIHQGDLKAIQLYMNITGEGAQNDASIKNLQVVIQRIIESIQRRVGDPEILAAISQDILRDVPNAAANVLQGEITGGNNYNH